MLGLLTTWYSCQLNAEDEPEAGATDAALPSLTLPARLAVSSWLFSNFSTSGASATASAVETRTGTVSVCFSVRQPLGSQTCMRRLISRLCVPGAASGRASTCIVQVNGFSYS